MNMTKTELKTALRNAYENRYGSDAIIEMGNLVRTDPDSPYWHIQLWYRDDSGVVNCNHDIYAHSADGTNFEWYNSDPTDLPPAPSSESSLREKILAAAKAKSGVDYVEILGMDNTQSKARLFAQLDDGTDKTVIAWLDSNGDLQYRDTSFTEIKG